MVTLIDIEKGKRSSKRRFILHIVFVSILSILVIGGSVASLLLSRLDYDLNLILNIVVDALYIIFIIFYFINVFPVVYHYYNLFRNMNNVSLEKRRHLVYLKEIDNRTFNNVNYRVLQFSYREGENDYIDNLYVLDNDYQFVPNMAYRLATYQNIIIRSEEINNAATK